MSRLRLCTWNVNGLRACAAKEPGFLQFLAAEKPDLLCLQETKAMASQLPPLVQQPPGYHTWFVSAQKKGYSGVALYARQELHAVTPGLGIPEFDDEGRTIVADCGAFVLLGCYFPNSGRDLSRLPYKLAYDDALLARVAALRAAGREVAICGDFNAAHQDIDLAHPKANQQTAGFLPEERAWVTRALETGLVDVFRARHPGENGHYTWWSYRPGVRERNIGWRLDYWLLTPRLAQQVSAVQNLTTIAGSDHCPVRLDLDLP